MQVSKDSFQLPYGEINASFLYTYFHSRYIREMKVTNSGKVHEQLVDRLYRRILEVNEQIYTEEVARAAAEGQLLFFACLNLHT